MSTPEECEIDPRENVDVVYLFDDGSVDEVVLEDSSQHDQQEFQSNGVQVYIVDGEEITVLDESEQHEDYENKLTGETSDDCQQETVEYEQISFAEPNRAVKRKREVLLMGPEKSTEPFQVVRTREVQLFSREDIVQPQFCPDYYSEEVVSADSQVKGSGRRKSKPKRAKLSASQKELNTPKIIKPKLKTLLPNPLTIPSPDCDSLPGRIVVKFPAPQAQCLTPVHSLPLPLPLSLPLPPHKVQINRLAKPASVPAKKRATRKKASSASKKNDTSQDVGAGKTTTSSDSTGSDTGSTSVDVTNAYRQPDSPEVLGASTCALSEQTQSLETVASRLASPSRVEEEECYIISDQNNSQLEDAAKHSENSDDDISEVQVLESEDNKIQEEVPNYDDEASAINVENVGSPRPATKNVAVDSDEPGGSNSSNQLEEVTDDALNLTSTTNFQSTHTTQTSDIDTSTTTTISSNYSTPSVSPGGDGTEIQVVGLDKVTTQQPGSKKKSALWKEALIQEKLRSLPLIQQSPMPSNLFIDWNSKKVPRQLTYPKLKKMASEKHRWLWQFMKELFSRNDSCLRWQNQAEGRFYLESMPRLGLLWGNYKNVTRITRAQSWRQLRYYFGFYEENRIIKQIPLADKYLYVFEELFYKNRFIPYTFKPIKDFSILEKPSPHVGHINFSPNQKTEALFCKKGCGSQFRRDDALLRHQQVCTFE